MSCCTNFIDNFWIVVKNTWERGESISFGTKFRWVLMRLLVVALKYFWYLPRPTLRLIQWRYPLSKTINKMGNLRVWVPMNAWNHLRNGQLHHTVKRIHFFYECRRKVEKSEALYTTHILCPCGKTALSEHYGQNSFMSLYPAVR